MREQLALFSDSGLLPSALPTKNELKPALHLASIFDVCHNYIYANEGVLKDQAFHEMVKILAMKFYDEKNNSENLLFGITSQEYKSLLANQTTSFEERMSRLFEMVKRQMGDFLSDAYLKLSPLTLAYIVSQLQFIDLMHTPGDVKGEAFQAFIYRHQRGDRGEFFTPYPIVRLAVKILEPNPTDAIIDPACGSGGFLIEAIAYIRRNFPNIAMSHYIKEKIRGVEFNPDIALSASMRIVFEGGTGKEIIRANALADIGDLDGQFDIVLTNPPFGSKGKIKASKILKSYELAHKWRKSGNKTWERLGTLLSGQSPEILFIEKSLRLLKPGGRMAIVVPDGLLQNISNEHIRYWLRSQARILGVVSIPQEAFIPYGTGIKTSLMIVQKFHLSDKAQRNCFMARMEKIGYDVKGQPIFKHDGTGRVNAGESQSIIDDDVDEIAQYYSSFRKRVPFKSHKAFVVSKDLLNSRLDVEHYNPEDINLIAKLQLLGAKPLRDVADILTSKDDFRAIPSQEIRYIAISDVDARTMQVVSQQRMMAYEAPSRAKYRLQAGDIITAIAGASTGTYKHATAIITDDEDGAICSNGFAVIRNIRGVEPLYLLAYMRTKYFLRQVRRLITGHAIPSLSLDDLSNVLIFIPPRDEQLMLASRMSHILSVWKDVLKDAERVVAEIENFQI
ncbi:MAG: restriction endonuclease subunit M/S [Methanobacteriota archaeon]|nr:MAG: restriction endonuclease subunit M/S [Euryarchaeota archaeon]